MNITNLKKMNTERLHRLYTKLTGDVLFNPYVERMFMFSIISVKLNIVEGEMSVKAETVEPVKVKQSGHIYEFEQNEHGVMVIKPTLSKLAKWWNEHGNHNAPEPTKGRIPEFTYSQVKQILLMDSEGVETKIIAKTFNTSYQLIYAIITGKSYKWALI